MLRFIRCSSSEFPGSAWGWVNVDCESKAWTKANPSSDKVRQKVWVFLPTAAAWGSKLLLNDRVHPGCGPVFIVSPVVGSGRSITQRLNGHGDEKKDKSCNALVFLGNYPVKGFQRVDNPSVVPWTTTHGRLARHLDQDGSYFNSPEQKIYFSIANNCRFTFRYIAPGSKDQRTLFSSIESKIVNQSFVINYFICS